MLSQSDRLGRAVLALVLALCGCVERPSVVEAIKASGELRVAVLASGATFYADKRGDTGIEHDLARGFAEWLKIEPRFIVAHDYEELTALVQSNRAHLGAGLLPISRTIPPSLRYGPSYAVKRQLVVYRRGSAQPRNPTDLIGRQGATIHGRGARAFIEEELPHNAGHVWVTHKDLAVEDLLEQVDNRKLDYAVLPSFEFEALRRYYPEVAVAFGLGMPQAVAWIYRADADGSLAEAQLKWLQELRSTGQFNRIHDRYFGRPDDFDYVASRTFLRHYHERLPQFRDAFIASAKATGIDWHLLAAMGYQESHWREDARSPTGVRGLMMLTRSTAAQLKVDRLDARASIAGGARYLQRMKKRLRGRIAEPDLMWLALAAYNIGLGHLEDARAFTAEAGKNPDRWSEVREFLPKLAHKTWAKKAKHGYARGHQALHFVGNVRRYYDVIRWLESDTRLPDPTTAARPLRLVSPAL